MKEIMQSKNIIGKPVVFLLVAIPVIFWLVIQPLSQRFASPGATLTSLGQLSGLVGIAMISLALFLVGRFGFLEDYFGGMDRIYSTHHLLNGMGFLLILFHPLVLSVKYLFLSTQSAAFFLLPSGYWPQNFGIFALLGMILFLMFTFYFPKVRYETRKMMHKFLGFAFFLASLHSFFIASDISRSAGLRLYMIFLIVPGLTVFVYRGLMSRLLVKKYRYRVERIRVFGNDIFEIEMSPLEEKIDFLPGQFVFVSFYAKNFSREIHPFSISSAPGEKNLKITVKVLGDYTARLNDLKVGAMARIEGPFGRFGLGMEKAENQIWVAGGIGITPFLSMARSLGSADRNIRLYYCTSSRSEAIFLNELRKISDRFGNFKVVPFCSQEYGRISAQIIKQAEGGFENKKIFLCGPSGMMEDLRRQFKGLSVPDYLIRSEEYQLL